MDLGAPSSYLVLAPGVPVFAADEAPLGAVGRVLADADVDIFDGLILDTSGGRRFVDAERVASIHERGVVLSLTAEQAGHLPDPDANPAVLEATPDDVAPESASEQVGDALRRAWDRISGKY